MKEHIMETTEHWERHSAGIVDGLFCAVRHGALSEEDFWDVLESLDFDKQEFLSFEIGDDTVAELLEREKA